MQRNSLGYVAFAFVVIISGILAAFQGISEYFASLEAYRAGLPFCKLADLIGGCRPFDGTQDLILIGLGLASLCLGIALLITEASRPPKIGFEKIVASVELTG
ncbi:MAG: hypothetical protein ACREBS_02035 [Nitrososphaerales archaeon]